MKQNSLTYRSMSGFLWKLLEKTGAQAVSFVIQIILARILLPEIYGIIAYLNIFIWLLDVCIKQGLTLVLIQKKDADEVDCSSVFWINLAGSVALYGIMYAAAPYIALFYAEPRLTAVTRVLMVTVIIGALGAVHEAMMAKQLDFKKSFYRGLANILSYGISGVIFAVNGFEEWSLVFGRILGTTAASVTLWLTVNWHPRLCFSWKRLRALLPSGSRMLGANLLTSFFNNIHSLIIGKFGGGQDLGQYERGRNIPQTIMLALDGSIVEVMYPAYSILQEDPEALKAYVRKSLKLSMYIVLPVMLGLAVVAEPLTLVLLTEKWLPSVPYMQLTCLICAFWPFNTREQALNALGRSDLTFRLSLISKGAALVFLIVFARMGVIMILWGSVLTSVVGFFATSVCVKKHLRYSLRELGSDLLPSVLLSAVMGGCVYAIAFLHLPVVLQLVLQIGCGVGIYVIGSCLFRLESFYYILGAIRKLTGKEKDTQ